MKYLSGIPPVLSVVAKCPDREVDPARPILTNRHLLHLAPVLGTKLTQKERGGKLLET